jgi:UDP-N-acetylmuramoyl-L-alanyl-D-glutamate--2,6-diaminopimelate ligase
MGSLKKLLRAFLPTPLVSVYHFLLAELGALVYGFPSRKLLVLAVTGTKGKSSTTEMVNGILEEAGYKTALLNSIRIKVAERSEPNMMRMSMPGRFFIQRFLRDAVRAGCSSVVLEMTSEGARQHRHRGIALDALVFTNLAPEHIESHGSYEAYADAKFELGKQLARSRKRPRIIVANADDKQSARYLALPVEAKIPFSLAANPPWFADDRGGYLTFQGEKISVYQPGEFSLKNALAGATLARVLGIGMEKIAAGLDRVRTIPGRAERIEAGQDFAVVVDYAHTPESLQALYDAYKGMRTICVMGSMGAGRDKWKRPLMGKVADAACDTVILTNEDPGDEDPQAILQALASGMARTPEMMLDRRQAIRRALEIARTGNAVLITGKGTDPWIYGPGGTKIPWSDAQVAREELEKYLRDSRV